MAEKNLYEEMNKIREKMIADANRFEKNEISLIEYFAYLKLYRYEFNRISFLIRSKKIEEEISEEDDRSGYKALSRFDILYGHPWRPICEIPIK